jgi:hypothetical protein
LKKVKKQMDKTKKEIYIRSMSGMLKSYLQWQGNFWNFSFQFLRKNREKSWEKFYLNWFHFFLNWAKQSLKQVLPHLYIYWFMHPSVPFNLALRSTINFQVKIKKSKFLLKLIDVTSLHSSWNWSRPVFFMFLQNAQKFKSGWLSPH